MRTLVDGKACTPRASASPDGTLTVAAGTVGGIVVGLEPTSMALPPFGRESPPSPETLFFLEVRALFSRLSIGGEASEARDLGYIRKS
jgi:hypothetical protein